MISRSARDRAAGLGAVALALAVVTAGCGGPSGPQTPPVATVSRATVATSVAATGSMSSTDKANVGFTRAGQLTEVNVRVGDVVRPGQILARIDDFPARQSLRQARTQLAGQQANFDRTVNGTGVDGAQSSLRQAQRILAATGKQASAQASADDRAVDDAEEAEDEARSGAAKAQAQLRSLTAACTAFYASQSAMAAQTQPGAGTTGTGMTGTGTTGTGTGTSPSTGGTGGAGTGSSGGSAAASGQVACTLLPGAQTGAQMAQQGVGQARSTLQQAVNTRKVNDASGRVQVENARNSVVMARNQLDSSSTDRPSNLEAARASLDGARVAVDDARRDVANAVLRAPIGGKVAVLNGAVGEFTGQSSSTTPFAPGGSASIPGAASDAAAAAAGGAQGAGAMPSRPGGNQFIVLQNASGFSVVAPFQEADATEIQPGQKAEVAVDALPDATLSGTVLSVAPTSSDIASVINYYVTVAVDRPDPRLRDGQTTRTSVITGEGKNALSVPNAAVIRQGDRSSVIALAPDGRQTPTPITPGLVGSERTEVVNGLDEGQQVLVTGNR